MPKLIFNSYLFKSAGAIPSFCSCMFVAGDIVYTVEERFLVVFIRLIEKVELAGDVTSLLMLLTKVDLLIILSINEL